MQFAKAKIESAADHVSNYNEIEVIYNGTNILVIAGSSSAINEFEAQLAAGSLEWDGEKVNGAMFLDALVNIQGVRTEFRPRHNDEWQARYEIVTD